MPSCEVPADRIEDGKTHAACFDYLRGDTMKIPVHHVKKHHSFGDFFYWNIVAAVPVITACIGIYRNSILWFVVYLIVCAVGVVLIYRFYCTHCPHYVEGGKTTKCMFFWGVPKFFTPRPGPLSGFDKSVVFCAPAMVILLPLYWLYTQTELLIIFVLSLTVFLLTVRRYECVRCTYFECPANQVSEEMKDQYRVSEEGNTLPE